MSQSSLQSRSMAGPTKDVSEEQPEKREFAVRKTWKVCSPCESTSLRISWFVCVHKWYATWGNSRFFGRILFFILTELGFLLLGVVTFVVVVPLSDAARDHEGVIKGAMTVLLVAWHTTALVPVHAFVAFIYSSEWRVIYRNSGNRFSPGDTDRLSTLNSDWIVRARYALSRSASWPFRLCFLAALLAPGLASVGSSAYFFADYVLGYDTTLAIGNIVFQKDLAPADDLDSLGGMLTMIQASA